MIEFHVIAIDPGCDCCSYVTAASFDTYREALEYAGDDENLIIEYQAEPEVVGALQEIADQMEWIAKSHHDTIVRVRSLIPLYTEISKRIRDKDLSASVTLEKVVEELTKALDGEQ